MKKITLSIIAFSGVITLFAADSFIKPQKKVIPRVCAEDCVEDSLNETASFSHILQYLGSSLNSIGRIMEKKIQYAQDMVEGNKKGILKKASKVQLDEYRTKQAIFDQQVVRVERALGQMLAQLDAISAEHDTWLNQFEQEIEVGAKKRKSA